MGAINFSACARTQIIQLRMGTKQGWINAICLYAHCAHDYSMVGFFFVQFEPDNTVGTIKGGEDSRKYRIHVSGGTFTTLCD